MGNALSGENIIFVRCYVKSESWILLRVVRISISDAFFSDPKTEADFFNTIGRMLPVAKGCNRPRLCENELNMSKTERREDCL